MNPSSDTFKELQEPAVIVAYLRGEASDKTVAEIESRIEADDAYALLVQEWDQNLLLMGEEAILRAGVTREAVHRALEQLQPNLERPRHKVIRPFWQKPSFFAMAAILAALIGLAWWNLSSQDTLPLDKLALAQAEAYSPRIANRGSASDQLAAIQQDFAEGKEDDAIGRVVAVIDDPEASLAPATRAELLLALANYNLRQQLPDLARLRLQGWASFPEKRQQAEAHWVIALSYVFEENVPAAQRELEAVKLLGIPTLNVKAQRLLDSLNV